MTLIILGILAAMIGIVALGAAVLGMLWLVQFVLRNEEKTRLG